MNQSILISKYNFFNPIIIQINLGPIKYFDAEEENISYIWGKETSGKFGVRKNYLEKAYIQVQKESKYLKENFKEKYLNFYLQKKIINEYNKVFS